MESSTDVQGRPFANLEMISNELAESDTDCWTCPPSQVVSRRSNYLPNEPPLQYNSFTTGNDSDLCLDLRKPPTLPSGFSDNNCATTPVSTTSTASICARRVEFECPPVSVKHETSMTMNGGIVLKRETISPEERAITPAYCLDDTGDSDMNMPLMVLDRKLAPNAASFVGVGGFLTSTPMKDLSNDKRRAIDLDSAAMPPPGGMLNNSFASDNIEVSLVARGAEGKRVRRFRCMHCHYESTKLYNVQRHTRKHTNTMIDCSRCGALFYEKYRLYEHIRIVHEGELLVCEHCGKMFASKSGLAAHVRSAHENSYRFSCEFCDKKFQSPSHYLGHMNRHFNIRPYQCATCQKGFTQRAQMKAHTLICQKEKEFKCELCSDASFKTKKYLLEHYRGKHSDRGYTCACGRKYPWRTSFKRHFQQCWASRMPRVAGEGINSSLFANTTMGNSSGFPNDTQKIEMDSSQMPQIAPSESSIAAANIASSSNHGVSTISLPPNPGDDLLSLDPQLDEMGAQFGISAPKFG